MEVFLAKTGLVLYGVLAGVLLVKKAHEHGYFMPETEQPVRDYNDVRFYYNGKIVGEPVVYRVDAKKQK